MKVTLLKRSRTTCTTVPLAFGNFRVNLRNASAGITASVVSVVALAIDPFNAAVPVGWRFGGLCDGWRELGLDNGVNAGVKRGWPLEGDTKPGEERLLADDRTPGLAETGLRLEGEARSSASAALGDADPTAVGDEPLVLLAVPSEDDRLRCIALRPSTGVGGESTPSVFRSPVLRLPRVPSSSWLTSEFCLLFLGRAVCENVSSGSDPCACSSTGPSEPRPSAGGVQEILTSSTNRLRMEKSELRVPPVETSFSR